MLRKEVKLHQKKDLGNKIVSATERVTFQESSKK